MLQNVKSQKETLRRLLVIAIPIILSNIINQTQMLIDRIFLGQTNTLYMSVLGNVNSPLWCTISFCFSLATGASILISQNVGAGNRERFQEYAGSMLKFNNIMPILLFFFWEFFSEIVFNLLGVSPTLLPMCIDYVRFFAPIFLLLGFESSFLVILQTSNNTKPLAWFGLIRSVLNVFFDWVLIFGNLGFPAMGIKGAALGTTLAEYIGFSYILVETLRLKNLETRPSKKNISLAKFKSYFHSARLGVNTALEDFAWNFGNLSLIRILNSISEMAAGIYSIVFGVEVIAVVIMTALGNGTMTISSEATGRQDSKQYKGVCACAYFLCLVICLAMILLSIFFPKEIISLFTRDSSIISVSCLYLLMISINLISKAANIIIGNGIRGSGDTKWMFMTQIFGTVFVVGTALLFVHVLKFGIAGVFLAILFDEFTRGIINLLKILRIARSFSKKA